MPRKHARLSRSQINALEIQARFFRGLIAKDPGFIEAIEELADILLELDHVEEVLKLDVRLKELCPTDPEVRYNLACSLSLNRNFEQAATELSSALELGFKDVQSLQSDPDLAELRCHPAFGKVRARLRRLKTSGK